MLKHMQAVGAALVALIAIAAQAQTTASAREPGVLVRYYDVGVDMRQVPELAPGEVPNAVRLGKSIDLHSSRGNFTPLKDLFVTEIVGFVNVARVGIYGFRLTSDDGARLWIDGKLVVDNDGLHASQAKDGHIQLAAGEHALRIMHFQAGADAQLLLEWQMPGPLSDKYEAIPESALTHASDASWETAAGKKRIVPPLRRGRPGDGTPITSPHPAFARDEKSSGTPCDHGFVLHDGWLVKVDPEKRIPVGNPVARIIDALPGKSYTVADGRIGTSECVATPLPGRGQFCVKTLEDAKRVVKDGEEQACVFRFGPALQGTVVPTGKSVFEMLAIRAMSDGFEIEFTKPLDPRVGWDPESYYVEQWPFDTQKKTPLRDGSTTPVKSASVSPDRKKVFLEIGGLKPSGVVYIRLLPPCVAEDGELPWSTEAWYTLNVIPKDRPGQVLTPPRPEPQNILTEAEQKEGWKLLFDGKTTQGWHGFKKTTVPSGWQVKNDCLARVGSGGDIVTDDEFDNFELKLEWRVTPGANSGIFFRVSEDEDQPWRTGPEMQILDNAEHADGRNPLTSAGSNYALHAPGRDVTQPVGLFNEVRLIVNGPHVEHWLNGVKIVEYELGSPEWEKLVAASKFSSMPRYGREKKGHIDLQDHGDLVWYRNIKIRPLSDSPK